MSCACARILPQPPVPTATLSGTRHMRSPRRYQHGATGWSCFALTAAAVQTVGTFDENIYPVYFEDQDYEWRLEKACVLGIPTRRSCRSAAVAAEPQPCRC